MIKGKQQWEVCTSKIYQIKKPLYNRSVLEIIRETHKTFTFGSELMACVCDFLSCVHAISIFCQIPHKLKQKIAKCC